MGTFCECNTEVEYRLAWRYVDEKKPRLALACFKRAAAQGDVSAITALGLLYDYPCYGLRRNPARAYTWYRIAALKGDAQAQNNLGTLLVEGKAVGRNMRRAVF